MEGPTSRNPDLPWHKLGYPQSSFIVWINYAYLRRCHPGSKPAATVGEIASSQQAYRNDIEAKINPDPPHKHVPIPNHIMGNKAIWIAGCRTKKRPAIGWSLHLNPLKAYFNSNCTSVSNSVSAASSSKFK